MEAKEKAKQLVEIFGKELAIKAVDEIIEAIRYRTLYETGEDVTEKVYVPHYNKVKQEILKL